MSEITGFFKGNKMTNSKLIYLSSNFLLCIHTYTTPVNICLELYINKGIKCCIVFHSKYVFYFCYNSAVATLFALGQGLCQTLRYLVNSQEIYLNLLLLELSFQILSLLHVNIHVLNLCAYFTKNVSRTKS